MSRFSDVARRANQFDESIAKGDLDAASDSLRAMRAAIKAQNVDGLGKAYFPHCCVQWLGRVVVLAEAQSSARVSAYEPWNRWFAEALANQKRYNRELAFVRGVLRS